MYCISLTLS
jgi:hypothetical protein